MLTKVVNGVTVALTAAEVTAREAEIAAWEAGADDRAAEEVRSERDAKLAETDWWASSDLTMSQEQIDYRQALRDVTSQAGFPHDVVWPTKP